MASHELQEHARQLSLFVAVWSTKQEQLLMSLSACTTTSPVNEPGSKEHPASPSHTSGSSGLNLDHIALEPTLEASHVPDTTSPVSPANDHMHDSGDIVPQHFHRSDSGDIVPRHSFTRRKRSNDFERVFLAPQEMVQNMLHHRIFANVTGIVILANAFIIAAATDHAMSNPGAPQSALLSTLELACAIYYVLEIVLKLSMWGKLFWRGADSAWNMFDLFLAMQAFIEQLQRLVLRNMDAVSNLSFFRTLRLFKALKVFRVVRLMRSFRELRLILKAFVSFGCMKAFVWACVLMVTLCFIISVAIMQSCSTFVSENYRADGNMEEHEDIYFYYASISTSMLSLVMASTGGQDWQIIANPLKRVGPHAYAIFIGFIALFNFVISNIVSSIFLEAMMCNAQHDSQFIIDEMIEKKQDYIDKLQLVYDEIDKDNDGFLSFGEFCKHTGRPEVQAFASALEIDISDAKHFFRVLSCDGKRTVDIQAFVDGCIKLKGMARSLDLMDLIYQYKTTMLEQRAFLKSLHEEVSRLDRIEDDLSRLTAAQTSAPYQDVSRLDRIEVDLSRLTAAVSAQTSAPYQLSTVLDCVPTASPSTRRTQSQPETNLSL